MIANQPAPPTRDPIEAINAVIEACALTVERYLKHYPPEIFTPPPAGQHGQTVDACSAAALRAVLPEIAADIRSLKYPHDPARPNP